MKHVLTVRPTSSGGHCNQLVTWLKQLACMGVSTCDDVRERAQAILPKEMVFFATDFMETVGCAPAGHACGRAAPLMRRAPGRSVPYRGQTAGAGGEPDAAAQGRQRQPPAGRVCGRARAAPDLRAVAVLLQRRGLHERRRLGGSARAGAPPPVAHQGPRVAASAGCVVQLTSDGAVAAVAIAEYIATDMLALAGNYALRHGRTYVLIQVEQVHDAAASARHRHAGGARRRARRVVAGAAAVQAVARPARAHPTPTRKQSSAAPSHPVLSTRARQRT